MSFDPITLAMAKSYTDKKAGYTETNKTVLFSEKELTFAHQDSPNPLLKGSYRHDTKFNIVIGEIYEVTFDGVKYLCEAKQLHDGDPEEFHYNYIGNIHLEDGYVENTGEPFVIFDLFDGEYVGMILTSLNGETHTVTITQETETVHTIDQKFIPAMDALVLNGADGKQYKLTVNNGAISVSEVV